MGPAVAIFAVGWSAISALELDASPANGCVSTAAVREALAKLGVSAGARDGAASWRVGDARVSLEVKTSSSAVSRELPIGPCAEMRDAVALAIERATAPLGALAAAKQAKKPKATKPTSPVTIGSTPVAAIDPAPPPSPIDEPRPTPVTPESPPPDATRSESPPPDATRSDATSSGATTSGATPDPIASVAAPSEPALSEPPPLLEEDALAPREPWSLDVHGGPALIVSSRPWLAFQLASTLWPRSSSFGATLFVGATLPPQSFEARSTRPDSTATWNLSLWRIVAGVGPSFRTRLTDDLRAGASLLALIEVVRGDPTGFASAPIDVRDVRWGASAGPYASYAFGPISVRAEAQLRAMASPRAYVAKPAIELANLPQFEGVFSLALSYALEDL